ncbi:E3 ubiquitin-protein ligase RNF165-like [Cynara cardunculus var. scolymus]|uniref:RING-type E3 ubiquitin transferase n=1 Tax=Cynara cardunculus var. scolymus TaxID=59895 RepID=A0A118JSQ3_CYNCS|nr:E3 ubiquitin-protein ligase RNF165-like [Cynara cardunculus var. scolymus]KVH88390.1 Zinc finger, RING/FYVE/PHD-type [Cynara cardunculus var. scolymus]
MNSRTNNTLNMGYWQQHTYEVYDDVPYDRIHVSSISLVPRSMPAVGSPMGPFGSIQDRAYMMPSFTRAMSQPPMQNLPRDTNMPRDVHPRPRFTHQSPRAINPISTGNDHNNGVEKLRREVYNPGVQRLSQYNNDDYKSRAKSQESRNNEDGKRCAVCLDDFEPRETVTLTPCHHMFHDNCIVPWVKSRGQCPVCRFVIGDPTNEREGGRTSNNGGLRNEAFEREFMAFIRTMEARG